jgi:AcrR family transcriptional regulator
MRARERILNAATALIERSGFQAVNMVAVAQEAGVSRQTVYTHFGSREELVNAAIARIASEVADRIHAQVAGTSDTSERIVEFVVAMRSEFSRHRVLGALLFPGGDSPLFDDDLFARAKPFAAQLLAPMFTREPKLAARFDDVLEIIMRFGLSILLFTSDTVRSDDDLRGFLRRSLIPALGL